MSDFDQTETIATPTTTAPSLTDDMWHGAEIGAVGGLVLPMMGPLIGGLAGGAAGAAGHLFRGLFDGESSKPAAGAAAPAATPGAPPAAAPAAAPTTGPANTGGPAVSQQTPATDEQKAAGKDLHDHQGTSDIIDDKDKAFDPNQKIGDLSRMTPEQRLAALNNVTQNDPNDPTSKDKCGPSALLAAAMAKGGNAGVQALIDKMKNDDQSMNPARKELGSDENGVPGMQDVPAGTADKQAELKALQEKLNDPKAGGLNQGDIKKLQNDLYQDMQKQQMKGADGTDGANNVGIGNKTMQNFINSDPAIASMFFDKTTGKQTMGLNNIDETGSGAQNHWVLDMNTDKGGKTVQGQDGNDYNTVYDPWKRAGGQVTTDARNPRIFDDYMHTDANTSNPVVVKNPDPGAGTPAQ